MGEENSGSRNGYYERDPGTRYGRIDDLMVPRDRENGLQSALLEPYQRNLGIDDLVVSNLNSYQCGKAVQRG